MATKLRDIIDSNNPKKNTALLNSQNMNSIGFNATINNMLRSDKFYLVITACFSVLLILQFIAICYTNLFQNQNHLGYDTSSFYLKAIEMWKQKTVFIENYAEQTTLQIDTPIPLAALFYGITKNIFIAYGMANIFCTIAIVVVADSIMRLLKIRSLFKIVALNFILSPYIAPHFHNGNTVEFFSTLYVSYGAYSVKVLLTLLILRITLNIYNRLGGIKNTILAIVCIFLVFISGLSSGYHIIAFALIPAFFFLFIQAIICSDVKHLFNRALLWLIIATVFACAGKVFAKFYLEYDSWEGGMPLTNIPDFYKNLGSIYLGFVDLMAAAPLTDVRAISLSGICYLMNQFLHIIFLMLVICSIIHIAKHKKAKNQTLLILICLIVSNLFVFTLLKTIQGSPVFEIRYLIPSFFCLVFLVAYLADSLNDRSYFKKFIFISLLGLLIFSNISSNIVYGRTIITDNHAIKNELKKYSTKIVYGVFGDNTVLLRNLRVLDPEKIYKLISFGKDGRYNAFHWGDYTYFDEGGEYQGDTLLLLSANTYEQLPEYTKKLYKLQKSLGPYQNLYQSNSNYFDFLNTLPDEKTVFNYPHTTGVFVVNGEIRENGFYSNGVEGHALYGPYASVKEGMFNFTLHYEVIEPLDDNIVGWFDVSTKNGTNVIGSTAILADQSSVTLKNISFDELQDTFEHRVFLKQYIKIVIISIEIAKVRLGTLE
jgi:hypothetical protein